MGSWAVRNCPEVIRPLESRYLVTSLEHFFRIDSHLSPAQKVNPILSPGLTSGVGRGLEAQSALLGGQGGIERLMDALSWTPGQYSELARDHICHRSCCDHREAVLTDCLTPPHTLAVAIAIKHLLHIFGQKILAVCTLPMIAAL
jgi:hypothetical protein